MSPQRLDNLYAELVIQLDCSFGTAGWDYASLQSSMPNALGSEEPPIHRVVSMHAFAHEITAGASITVSPTGQVTQWSLQGSKTGTCDFELSSQGDRWDFNLL